MFRVRAEEAIPADRRGVHEAPVAVGASAIGVVESLPKPESCRHQYREGSNACVYCNERREPEQAPELRPYIAIPASLTPRFSVKRLLPVGSQADVVVVEDLEDRDEKVIKLYRTGLLPKREVLDKAIQFSNRFPQHAIRIYECDFADGRWYEVQELAKHGSLRQFMGGAISAEYVRVIVCELAEALTQLHKAGIWHRDLKPENVLVRETVPLDLALADFGIASDATASERLTTLACTVPYAAPEASSGIVSHKVDYWSLGVIVYELITGVHPFADLSDPVILLGLFSETNPIDFTKVEDASTQQLCRGLLHRSATDRWGASEISIWLSGSAPTLAADSRPSESLAIQELRSERPYHLGGQQLHTLRDLARELGSSWNVATEHLKRGLLRQWVQDDLRHQELAVFMIGLEEQTTLTVDERLARFLGKVNPTEPVYKGRAILPQDLAAMATSALKGDRATGDIMAELFQAQIPEVYSAPALREAWDAWVAAERVYAELCEEAGEYEPDLNIVLPLLYLLGTDQEKRLAYDEPDVLKKTAWKLHSLMPRFFKDRPVTEDSIQKAIGVALRGDEETCLWLAELFSDRNDDLWAGMGSKKCELCSTFVSGLESLSVEVATALAGGPWKLPLDNLKVLTDKAGEALAERKHPENGCDDFKWYGPLSLDGLTTISIDLAKIFARASTVKDQFFDTISLQGLTAVSVDLAEALAAGDYSLSLRFPAGISMEVAQRLVGHGGDLTLTMPNISEKAAKALSKKKKGNLEILGIENLSTGTANALARFEGNLSLGLSRLSVDAAAALGNLKGNLRLSSLTCVSTEAAEAMSQLGGRLTLFLSQASLNPCERAFRNYGGKLSLEFDDEWFQSLSVDSAAFVSRHTAACYLPLVDLTSDMAEVLAHLKGTLVFPSLKSLAVDVAEALSKHQGNALDFSGLSHLSVEAAAELANYKGELSLGRLESVSADLAEALAAFEGTKLRLDGLTGLSMEAAVALASYGGEVSIGLRTMTDVSGEAANYICLKKGWVALETIKAVSAEVAGEFAMIEGELRLDGLEHISVDVAAALAEHKGHLSLKGVGRLTAKVAEALSAVDGDLSLDGLMSLSPAVATALTRHEGALSLRSVCPLSPETARRLAEHYDQLTLNGLRSITLELAEALAEHSEGWLVLDGLRSLSPECAEALSKHSGQLSLDGLDSLSRGVADALAKHDGRISLEGITRLTDVSANAAKILVLTKGWISTDQVNEISAEVAEEFAKHDCGLQLNGLTDLSTDVAAALAQHRGWLSLGGLTTLTPEVAVELAKYYGILLLPGLTSLSAEAADTLKHKVPADQLAALAADDDDDFDDSDEAWGITND